MTDVSTIPVNLVLNNAGSQNLDVFDLNLSDNLLVKDFFVVNADDGSSIDLAYFSKTSREVIAYNGPAVSSVNITIFRNTPVERYQTIQFADVFDSSVYNEEVNRMLRMIAERTLAFASIEQTLFVVDQPFGSGWQADTTRSRSAKALYDQFIVLGNAIANNLSFIEQNEVDITNLNTSSSNNLGFINQLTARLDSLRAEFDDRIQLATQFVCDSGLTNSGSVTPNAVNYIRNWLNPERIAPGVIETEFQGVTLPASMVGSWVEVHFSVEVSDADTLLTSCEAGISHNGNVVQLSRFASPSPHSGVSLSGFRSFVYDAQTPINVWFRPNTQVAVGASMIIKAA